MLERVYGRQTPEQLAALMARAMGLTSAPNRARPSTPALLRRAYAQGERGTAAQL